jgi:DNA gyrase subunit A
VVVELKRDAEHEVVLAQLFRFTPLQTSFGVNMLALLNSKPQQLNLRQIIVAFVEFREEVIRRRTIYELGKARDRAHVLAGLAVAVSNIDKVIALIRAASDPQTARTQLMEFKWPAVEVAPMIALLDEPGHGVIDGTYMLSETQAKAILELRLHRLTGLERDKIGNDLRELGNQIAEYLSILESRQKLYGILRNELVEVRARFANDRRSSIEESEFEHDLEDLIQREDMVVTVTNSGYIKRVPLSTYRAQKRGGKGRSGMSTRDEDFVAQVFVVNTHTPVLFFSSTGMVYKTKVYRLPLGTPQARGKALINLLPLNDAETISTLMPMPEDEETWANLFVMFATASGSIRRNSLSDFVRVQANGKIAMKLDEGDQLVRVRTCTAEDDVLLLASGGKVIRFPVTDVRVFSGRTSTGVRGIRLATSDKIIAMSVVKHRSVSTETRDDYLQAVNANRRMLSSDYMDRADDKARDEVLAARLNEPEFVKMALEEEFILTLTEDGMGKRTSAYQYRIAGRGGLGITGIELGRADGKSSRIVAAFTVQDEDQVVMVSDGGQIIRCPVNKISIVGRSSRGVSVFNTSDGERVVSVSRLRDVDDDNEVDYSEEVDEEQAAKGSESEVIGQTPESSTESLEEKG